MTTQQAFAAYEAVRSRLPDARATARVPVNVENLDDIAGQFDVFLLDAFGVLNIGERAIPGVADRIEGLRASGKRVLVVSNAAGFPHDRLVEKYSRLGFGFASDDIITSRKALVRGVNDISCGRMLGLMISDGMPAAEFDRFSHVRLQEDRAAYAATEVFVMIGSATWTEERQSLLEAALIERPRPVLVGNPDIVAPREVGFSIEPGHFAHRLADRTGVSPQFFGKPFSNIFTLAFERLGDVDRSRVVMVGDSLHTDILGAQCAGVASALISQFGFFAGQGVPDAIARAGIVPDYVVTRP
jgi:HAD superfamily hydrolase (TIGR01450 family)